jgi:DNA-binding MarR family transcriptional regulator
MSTFFTILSFVRSRSFVFKQMESSYPSRDMRDSVDKVIDAWRELRPDLDASPIGVVARLRRVRSHFDQELDAFFADHDLTLADFEMLTTLRRLGGASSQRGLMHALRLTSGTVSVRIDRLVAAGLVTRKPDPQDGRGAIVALTAEGHSRFDAAAPAHLANEDRLLAALDSGERAQLADLLRKLLLSLEDAHQPARLGVGLASAHVARRMRRAVGLPDRPGLLVQRVEPDSPAARAGVREGDLLVTASGRELHSVAQLQVALSRAKRTLTLDVVRGAEDLRTRVRLR